ncbi:hypothetical protein WDU94_003117 [Cyamophila willieti]
MKPTYVFLLIVAMCALSIAHAEDDNGDDVTTKKPKAIVKPRRKPYKSLKLNITTPTGSGEETTTPDILPTNVFPTTEDPDDVFNETDFISARRNSQPVCLKDQHVRKMTDCLYSKCRAGSSYGHQHRCDKTDVMNRLRHFIHHKSVKHWWTYLSQCLRVRLTVKTVAVFTKCYLVSIPT